MRKLTQINSAETKLPSTSNIVGRSYKHESAIKQVTGDAMFLDDYPTPKGCLHAAIVSATIAKGSITSLDLNPVKTMPGVVAVYDYNDIPGEKDIGAIVKGDPLLSDHEIKFYQQPIALVLARTHTQALQAAKQAKIEYDIDPNAVLDCIQDGKQDEVLPTNTMGTAITDEQFDKSDMVITGQQHVGGQEHFYLEGQISLAELTEDGGIFLRTSSQHPTEVQTLVAEVLGISFNKVTVDMRRMGGGFGGKETQAAQWACLASMGAFLTRKAVKIRLPRSIDMSVTGKRHPFFNQYKIGVNQQGLIETAQIEVNGLCGHSADLSGAIVDRAMFHSDNAYFLADACVTGKRLKTDTVSHTAFRGFGGPQGMMVIEKAMQDISIAVGEDALDIRLKNLYREGKNTTHYGMQVEQHQELKHVITELETRSDYRKRREEIDAWNKTSPILKKGLALTPVKFGIAFTATHLNQAGALIHVYTDGSVQVSHGGTEMGQGLHTKIQQIVAQTLGIPFELVLVTSTRTDKVPNTSPTAASSGADLNGMAAHNAAKEIKTRLIEFALKQYATPQADEQTVSQGQMEAEFINGTLEVGDQQIDWHTLVQQAYLNRVSLSASGFYKTPKIWYDQEKSVGRPFFYFSLGASCSEVTIDTLTGEMRVDRVDILHDVGNSLNPAIDLGQIEGGFIQGLGWLTTEELVWNTSGALLSNSPMNYKIPTIGDYPKQMNIDLYDKANPEHSIYRSKAVGEPPFMHAISVWCAIYDAVGSITNHTLAVDLNAPATGEAILNACTKQFERSGRESTYAC
ncbi:xanthine dehydrogenase molybdopterin binding subunit [Vibrio sp. TH_r3]|uniref:xanthine dehydrogenase molybdopterin binding subunit n=1 Tax=Vibrio sp. TH_r3 TaxID=3082084 RepID=UPI00295312D8|nr:xanthine dehydrogenase molybdopterin binding subunit [Vibrio sp. TH_r3]MDV7104945.1 xanthine dehydrogenase molybdopterin binding subunit [Vibrio sp. TH_r3]